MRQRSNEAEAAAGLGDTHSNARARRCGNRALRASSVRKPRADERQRQILVERGLRRFRRAASPRSASDPCRGRAPIRSVRGSRPRSRPSSATALILIFRPAACAASIPAITWSSAPQRVMARNLSGSSVSSDTLIRRTPWAASSAAYLASCEPLVVSVELVKPLGSKMPGERVEQGRDTAADQRFAASQAKLAHPAPDEGRARAGRVPRVSADRLWAGTTYVPPCNRHSGNRSDPSPRHADRKSRGRTDRPAPAVESSRSPVCRSVASARFTSTLSIGRRFHDVSEQSRTEPPSPGRKSAAGRPEPARSSI